MTVLEEVVRFDSAGIGLVGVLARPAAHDAAATPAKCAVLVIVGGPQYRAGSHRQFVLLARALAAAGHPVLRFDYRGMGDSDGDAIGFEHATPDIGVAVDVLQRECPASGRVVLWGLCDAAAAALLYVHETRDARIGGLSLLNPWVRSEATLARTHVKHYYRQRLMQPDFWTKLFRGGVARGAAIELLRNLGHAARSLRGRRPARGGRGATLTFQQRMAIGLAEFAGPVALLLSGRDYTAKEFLEFTNADPRWRAGLRSATLSRFDFETADHTFSGRRSQQELERVTLAWLDRLVSGEARGTGRAALVGGRT